MIRSIAIFLAAIASAGVANAALITAQYSIMFDGGYSAEGTITYDDSIPIVSGEHDGPTNGIEYLDITFFDPSDVELYSFVDISGGVSNYEFLEIEFDTTTPNFLANSGVDLGQDTGAPEEIYLHGDIGATTQLFVGAGDVITDVINPTVFTVTVVPEPSTLALAALGLMCMALRVKRGTSP